jgi:hypothetical protein
MSDGSMNEESCAHCSVNHRRLGDFFSRRLSRLIAGSEHQKVLDFRASQTAPSAREFPYENYLP